MPFYRRHAQHFLLKQHCSAVYISDTEVNPPLSIEIKEDFAITAVQGTRFRPCVYF